MDIYTRNLEANIYKALLKQNKIFKFRLRIKVIDDYKNFLTWREIQHEML